MYISLLGLNDSAFMIEWFFCICICKNEKGFIKTGLPTFFVFGKFKDDLLNLTN